MQAELTAYGNYYKQKHSGHTLDWDHALGTVTLLGRFQPGNKELSVSLYQAVVLLLFNDTPELPYAEILTQTRMGMLLGKSQMYIGANWTWFDNR